MTDLPLFDPYKALAEIRRNAAREVGKSLPKELPQKLPQAPAEAIPVIDHRVKLTSAASATSAGGPDAHTPPRARIKERKEENNIYISMTYAGGGGQGQGPAVRGGVGPAEVAEAAEVSLSHSEQSKKPKIAVAEVLGGELRKWHSGLSALSADSPPCPGYRLDEWPRVLSRALAFLDTFGPQAEALGWTASRLFGVHAVAGIVRTDACGALVLPISGPVRAITATEVRFGHLTHRTKPGQPAGVPWWEFGR